MRLPELDQGGFLATIGILAGLFAFCFLVVMARGCEISRHRTWVETGHEPPALGDTNR